jgi:hypothetical protein
LNINCFIKWENGDNVPKVVEVRSDLD